MTLAFDEEQIPFIINKSTGGRISFRFRRNTTLLEIETPTGKLNEQARDMLNKHKKLIVKNYRSLKAIQGKREEFLKRLAAGKVLYKGKEIRFVIQEGRKRWVKLENDVLQLIITHKDAKVPKKQILFAYLKTLAKNHIEQRTQELAQHTQSQFGTIRVKNIKSKWGSCSSKRNLNFNWHLIFLPDPLIDYIIVHELMHLRELNHSPAFWAWVEKFYPNYKEAETSIRNYEWVIGILDEE